MVVHRSDKPEIGVQFSALVLNFKRMEVITIFTAQDFYESDNIEAAIITAINDHKSSPAYKEAEEAQAYYAGNNLEIMRRLTYLQRHGLEDSKVKYHKLCSGFFPKLVKQLSQYLLGNGVTLEEQVKSRLGIGFDKQLQRMGVQALVDGSNWGFWNVDKLVIFRVTEFVPLFDEQTGDLMAGIRFWQIHPDKPLYVELFEIDGITKFKGADNGSLQIIQDKKAYITKLRIDALGEEITDTENYPMIPIFQFKANDLGRSALTPGIRSMIDAYDFINSDLADGITQIEGLYKTIKDYGGDDAAQLINELQQLKATATVGDDSSVDFEVIEIPYEAKQTALELLRKQIYSDFQGLDMDTIKGSSLTNVAIKASMSDLDLRADELEWGSADLVHSILELLGIKNEEAQFKRRTLTNDTETVTNIYTARSDLDHRSALELNPTIPDSMVDEILDRYAIEQLGINEEEEIIEEENIIEDGGE